ncbi:Protein kinase [Globisporangium polare]
MGRMPKHKAAKAAVTKRRNAKKSGSSARRTPGTAATASLAESVAMANAAAGSASPTGSVSTAGGSTPSSSAKECEQCGNPTMLDGVASTKIWSANKKLLAPNGCQICDFVMYSKTLRPCVHCERSNCEHFCEWCGDGYHTKCARTRDEKVNAPNGFCCRKCEAEQADDDEEKDAVVDDKGSRCGSCRLPFNSTTAKAIDEEEEMKSAPAEESGFKVNQSVLVENDEVLYNAVITEVDMKGERIKIHFIRWSKSFDNWYAMDDERINESLACDCCNHWFHIGCLPPIKSSGRFKDTTYVCPTCIDDAKHFHNGTRSSSKAKAALVTSSSSSSSNSKSSTRKSSMSEDVPVVLATSKRKSSRPIITSDDEQETKKPVVEKEKQPNKKKRKLSITSDSPVKKKPELSRAASRSKSPDPPAAASSPQSTEKPAADTKKATTKATTSTETESTDHEKQSEADAETSSPSSFVESSTVVESQESSKSPPPEPAATTSKPSKAKSVDKPSPAAVATEKQDEEKTAASTTTTTSDDGTSKTDKTQNRRKVSSHSVSSLLNSPSPNEKPATPPVHSNLGSLSMLDEGRRNLTSSFDVFVKVERNNLPPMPSFSSRTSYASSSSSSSSKLPTSVAKLEPYQSSNWPIRPAQSNKPSTNSSGRGSLSAFDILREVATQSIGGELDAVAPPAPKAKKPRVSAAKAKALKAEKAAIAAKNGPAGASSTAAPPPTGATPAEQDRLFQSKERIHLNSFVDLHFNIRKEMYLKFCYLEEQGLIDRDTAQLLRSLIYPTSDKFQDLKFVYLVNKDLSPLYLTKRLLEVVPTSLGGTGVAPPPSSSLISSSSSSSAHATTSVSSKSVASSPASTNHTTQQMPTIVPPGLTIPSFSEIIASEKAAALQQQHQQQQQHHMHIHSQQSHPSPSASAREPLAKSPRPAVMALHSPRLPMPLQPQPSSTSPSSVQSQPEKLLTRLL